MILEAGIFVSGLIVGVLVCLVLLSRDYQQAEDFDTSAPFIECKPCNKRFDRAEAAMEHAKSEHDAPDDESARYIIEGIE